MQYKITSGENYAVLGLEGAQLNSLTKNGREYLWQGDPDFWAGQAPVCFPIVGVLPDGKAKAFGKDCNMKRHGVARINPFEVFKQHKNSVTFVQKSSEETKKQFPFDYELKIKYTIVGDTVTNEYMITNTGNEKLPFVIGGHPAFNCPVDEDECFEDYYVIFDRKQTLFALRPDVETGLIDVTKRYPVLNNARRIDMNHQMFEKDALVFDNIKSKSVTLMGKNSRGVRVDFQDMNNLLIWSAVGHAPFVALEPWTGISSCSDEDGTFENKRGMTILAPDETVSFKFKITMI